MTNVDFFRAFSQDTTYKASEYYFEHSREELDFSNLYDGKDSFPVKIFHYTTEIEQITNESGRSEGVQFEGSFYAIVSADLDEMIDTQEDNPASNGKYELHVRDLVDFATSISTEIRNYNNCTDHWDLEITGGDEVYNQFDNNLDGVQFDYTLYIRNGIS